MASKIRVLDEHTINKIAAGEVIEGPASVVKEMVENSLDAGATEISVEIKGGGRQLIRISDNGCGMNRDDALLCLERHATSKIKDVEDIQSILTMGFRGEAVPSIASISKFTLLTCPKEEAEGTLLMVDGGRLIQCGSAVCSPGTTIEVKSLFFNVPVRRKFQRSPAHDAQDILKKMTVLALGYPSVKFQLINNQKVEIQTGAPPQAEFLEQLKDRIHSLMGSEFLTGCSPLQISKDDYHVQGFIGLPEQARNNRSGQYLFINHRAVFSPLISYFVREAYGTALSSTKHPLFVLHISVPGEVIDVNVHPQKKEVRLRQEAFLKEIIFKGVNQALQQGVSTCHPLFIEETKIPDKIFESHVVKPVFSLMPKKHEQIIKEYVPPAPNPKIIRETPTFSFVLQEEKKSDTPRVLNTIPSFILLDALSMVGWQSIPQDSLCLLDQKAAHARVIFEHLLRFKNEKSVQPLLIPYTINLLPHEAVNLRNHVETFHASGIHIHEIGPTSFMVDSLPSFFGNVDVHKLINNLLENIDTFLDEKSVDKVFEKKIAHAASAAAVNSNKRLHLEEAQTLVNRLFQCLSPFLCPQGKPTFSYFKVEEIVKKFQKDLK